MRVDTGGAKYGDFSYWAKFPEARFPMANLFAANFPRTESNMWPYVIFDDRAKTKE